MKCGLDHGNPANAFKAAAAGAAPARERPSSLSHAMRECKALATPASPMSNTACMLPTHSTLVALTEALNLRLPGILAIMGAPCVCRRGPPAQNPRADTKRTTLKTPNQLAPEGARLALVDQVGRPADLEVCRAGAAEEARGHAVRDVPLSRRGQGCIRAAIAACSGHQT